MERVQLSFAVQVGMLTLDRPFLGKLLSGDCSFTALQTLDLVFLGKAMTAAELEAFD